MKAQSIIATGAAIALLAACSEAPSSNSAPDNKATASPSPDEPVSILRPDVEQPAQEAKPLVPLKATVGFPGGGAELDADAVSVLEEVLESDQVPRGGPIILRAHSDSEGTAEASADLSEARGLAVAAWLIEKGVADNRIEVIVFGEQNPIEPNALPDGSPNEAGRAANRRVEIDVGLATDSSDAETHAPAAAASIENGD